MPAKRKREAYLTSYQIRPAIYTVHADFQCARRHPREPWQGTASQTVIYGLMESKGEIVHRAQVFRRCWDCWPPGAKPPNLRHRAR